MTSSYLQERTLTVAKKQKRMLVCKNEAQQSIQKILWLKLSHMQRGDQKNPQTNYRKHFMSTKEQQNRAILANSSISTYDNGEMRHIQTKTSIWIHSWSNQFWNRIANVSVKKDEESSNQNLVHGWKKSQSKYSWNYTHLDIEPKEKCIHFPSYMS